MKPLFNTLIFRLYRLEQEYLRPYAKTLDLSSGQPRILRYLSRNDGCMQIDLANYYAITSATVSSILDGLEEKGMVRRVGVKDDRRSFAVCLTELGKRTAEKWDEYLKQSIDKTLEGFSEGEIQQFENFIVRAINNLQED